MLEQNTGIRKGKVSLGSIADEGPVGTQKKIAKQLLATQDLSSEERIRCVESITEAVCLAGITWSKVRSYISVLGMDTGQK